MPKALLPLLREIDKFRCVSCGDCVRACLPGVLELVPQSVPLGIRNVVIRAPVIRFPELCDHEARCLVACSQKVFPMMREQDVGEVSREAERAVARSLELRGLGAANRAGQ